MTHRLARKMWVLVDKELDQDAQLYQALDGRLYVTKPIPAHPWLKPVRVAVTIEERTPHKRRGQK